MCYPTFEELMSCGIDAVSISARYAHPEDGQPSEYVVYGWGEYEEDSVLAGQTRKLFLAGFPTLDEAREAFPDAYVVN